MSVEVIVWAEPETAPESHERLCTSPDRDEVVMFHPATRTTMVGGVLVLECDACGEKGLDRMAEGTA